MRLSSLLAGLFITGLALSPFRAAEAHVDISSGLAEASKSQKITFAVGHGCEGADTVRVRVEIPAAVTSVRALFSDFGKPTVIRSGTTVTAVEWQKADADLLDADDGYYELTIRARIPNAAFTRIAFVITQVCRSSTGVETTVVWDQPPGSPENTAPLLTVVPPRSVGWNKIVLDRGVAAADLPLYFRDAQIVWRGNAAYSANPNTMTQIGQTAGVTALSGDLAAGDELWVRY